MPWSGRAYVQSLHAKPACKACMAALSWQVDVDCVQRVGVSDARWKKWQRTISTMLLAQNGSLTDALLQWKSDVRPIGLDPFGLGTATGRAAWFQGQLV